MPYRFQIFPLFRVVFALSLLLTLYVSGSGQENTPEIGELVSAKKISPASGLPKNTFRTGPVPLPTRIANQELFTKKNPTNGIAFNDLGVLYVEAERYTDGIAALEKSIKLDPRVTKSHFNLSVAYERSGQVKKALPPAKLAATKFPNELNMVSHYCAVLFVLRERNDTVRCYESAVSKWPSDLLLKSNYAAALLFADQSKKATTVLTGIIRTYPNHSGAYNALGIIQQKGKKYKEAVVSFKRAVEIEPERSMYRFNLALAHMATKNRAGAISQYNFLKTSDPPIARQLYKMIFAGKIIHVPKPAR